MSGTWITSPNKLTQETVPSPPSQTMKLPSFRSLFPMATWYCNGVYKQEAQQENALAQEILNSPNPKTDNIPVHPNTCQICLQLFENRAALEDHLKEHTNLMEHPNKKRKRTSEPSQENGLSSWGVAGMGTSASDNGHGTKATNDVASSNKRIRLDAADSGQCYVNRVDNVPTPTEKSIKIMRYFCHICDRFFEDAATLEVHIREHADIVNPPDKENVIASFVAKGYITKCEMLWCYKTLCGKNVAVIRCYYLGTSCQFTMQKEI